MKNYWVNFCCKLTVVLLYSYNVFDGCIVRFLTRKRIQKRHSENCHKNHRNIIVMGRPEATNKGLQRSSLQLSFTKSLCKNIPKNTYKRMLSQLLIYHEINFEQEIYSLFFHLEEHIKHFCLIQFDFLYMKLFNSQMDLKLIKSIENQLHSFSLKTNHVFCKLVLG